MTRFQYDGLMLLAKAAEKRLEKQVCVFQVNCSVYVQKLILFTKIVATCIKEIYMSKKKKHVKNVLIVFSNKLTVGEKCQYEHILNDLWIPHTIKGKTFGIKFPHTLPNQRILYIHQFVFSAIRPQKDELEQKLQIEYDMIQFTNSMRKRMENLHNKIHTLQQSMNQPINTNKNLKTQTQELHLQQQKQDNYRLNIVTRLSKK